MSDHSGKLLPLESLRGLAALAVVLHHFKVNSHFHGAIIEHAWLMVDFFFVLSGFVITLNYQDRLRSWSDVARFQTKRFARLYPLHLLLLIVFLGIECLKWVALQRLGLSGGSQPFEENSWESFTANVTLLHNWTWAELTWNYPSWSISAEYYTYLLYGLIVLGTVGRKSLFVILAALIAFGAALVLGQTGFGIGNVAGPARVLLSFFLGVLSFQLYRYLDLRNKVTSGIWAILPVALAIWIELHQTGPMDPLNLFEPLVFCMVVLAFAGLHPSTLVYRLSTVRPLVYLGTISYGIYMIHAAVWWGINQVGKFALGMSPQMTVLGDSYVDFQPIAMADVATLIGLVIVFILAHISYHMFERPMMRRITGTPKETRPAHDTRSVIAP